MGNAEDAAMTITEAVGNIGVDVEAIELNQIDMTDLQSTRHCTTSSPAAVGATPQLLTPTSTS